MEDFEDFDNDNLGRDPSPLIVIGLGLGLIAGLAKGLYELFMYVFY